MLLVALAGSSAAAQRAAPTATPEETVVVTAAKKPRDDTVRDFVTTLSDQHGNEPIARFSTQTVCPGVAGLSDANNLAIAARMRRVAEAAKIPIADAQCRPNTLVLFARDKHRTLKELQRKFPVFFQQPTRERVDIPSEAGPVTAWQLRGNVDRDDTPVGYLPGQTPTVSAGDGESRLSALVRPVFLAAVVIVETGALDGLTINQIADYAAMRAFTGVRPRKPIPGSVPTILTVLDTPMGGTAPGTLTAWDLGYLRGLYAVPANHLAHQQRTAIKQQIMGDLNKADGAGK